MDVLTAVAPVFGTNCYVLVADDGAACVVVDVGAGIARRVRAIIDSLGLRPAAVLATHGHVDHTWDAAQVSEAYGVPVLVHAADAYRLADPFGTLGLGRPGDGSGRDRGGPLAQALSAAGIDPADYRCPARIETFGPAEPDVAIASAFGGAGAPRSADASDLPPAASAFGGVRAPRSADASDLPPAASAFGGVRAPRSADASGAGRGVALDLGRIEFAGGPLRVLPAPGHTQGASLFLIDGVPGSGSALPFAPGEEGLAVGASRTALTGDVLFAGSIGRTDLPGGDDVAMAATLRFLTATITPTTLMLPGHGPATRMDVELRRNPYLAG